MGMCSLLIASHDIIIIIAARMDSGRESRELFPLRRPATTEACPTVNTVAWLTPARKLVTLPKSSDRPPKKLRR